MAQRTHPKNGGIRNMKDQELDKLISDRLRDLQVEPPASVWQAVESSLEQDKIIPMKSRNNWKGWTIAACLLIALGFTLKTTLFQGITESNLSELANQKEETNMVATDTKLDVERPSIPSEDLASIHELTSEKENKIIAPKEIKRAVAKPRSAIYTQEPDTRGTMNAGNRIALQELKPNDQMIIPAQEMKIIHSIDQQEDDVDIVELSSKEVAPIPPLVNIIEQEEVMYAQSQQEPKKKQTLFTNILNTLTENINPSKKTVKFSSDEEGTITIDLYNSIAKTRR